MCDVVLLSGVKQSDSHLWTESEKQYVCICICNTYVCIWKDIYIYIYICADSFQNLRKDIYLHVCMYIQILFFSGSEKADIYIYIFRIWERTHTHTHTHICMYIQILFICRLLQYTKYSSMCYTIGPRGLWILYIVVSICQSNLLLYPLSPSVAIIWASVPEGLFLSCK